MLTKNMGHPKAESLVLSLIKSVFIPLSSRKKKVEELRPKDVGNWWWLDRCSNETPMQNGQPSKSEALNDLTHARRMKASVFIWIHMVFIP